MLFQEVEINGELYQPSWSTAPHSDGANSTDGVVARADYHSSKEGLPADTGEDFLWVGGAAAWVLFDRSGNDFVPNPGNWEGVITLYEWSNNKWVESDRDEVWEPSAPDDCPKHEPNPGATSRNECTDEGVVVTLTNKDGESSAHFTVSLNDAEPDEYTVAPNDTKDVVVFVSDGQTYVIRVKADNGFTEKFEGTRDCEPEPAKPTATVINECTEDGVSLVLGNKEGGSSYTFTVTIGVGTPTEYMVEAGAELAVPMPVYEGEEIRVLVTGLGDFSVPFTIIRECEPTVVPPDVTVGEFCKVANTKTTEVYLCAGGQVVTFTVTYNDPTTPVDESATPFDVRVEANSCSTVTLKNPLKADDPPSALKITNSFNEDVKTESIISCSPPTPLNPGVQPLPQGWLYLPFTSGN